MGRPTVRLQLDERHWQKVKAAQGVRTRAGRPGRDELNFVEAVLWWRRTDLARAGRAGFEVVGLPTPAHAAGAIEPRFTWY